MFEPVNLTLTGGQCVEIRGGNGAGKTTLLRTLAGLHTQYTGAFECGRFVFQGHRLGLDSLLNAVDNLTWFAMTAGADAGTERVRGALDAVGMRRLATVAIGRLSQGQQRRIAMARWLCGQAGLWLLDEPATALDNDGQALLTRLLVEHLQAGGAAAYATHAPLDLPGKQVLTVRSAAGEA